MAQKHNVSCIEQPMTVATTEQGPQKRYRRLRFPSFSANIWAEKNPLLQKGELGHELDTGFIKVGDGVSYWNDLPYAYSSGYTREEVDDIVSSTEQDIRSDMNASDSELQTQITAHAGEITTIKNDLGDLGDQVAEIEAKIPGSASVINQLATQNDITNKITNCITEIPQDINLELNNGTLTLKAGSKYYLPNGLSGSTSVFTEKTLTGDYNIPIGFNGQRVMLSVGLGRMSLNRISSGTTAPANPGNNDVWYDTTNNQFKVFSTSTGTWTVNANISLPIGIATANADGTGYVSIDQVFNGIGYVGRTIFVTPGVKCLIPNGYNADGTLKNLTGTITQTQTITVSDNSTYAIRMHDNYLAAGVMVYDRKTNRNYNQSISPENARNDAVIGSITTTSSGGIVLFEPKFAFHAVDYSDTEYIAHQAMPSNKYIDLTLGESSTAYTAPADGYIKITKNATAAGQYIDIYTTDTEVGTTVTATGAQALRGFCPVSKGDRVTISYTAAGTTGTFRFVYANGAK